MCIYMTIRVVCDDNSKYATTAALLLSYSVSVLGLKGSPCQIFRYFPSFTWDKNIPLKLLFRNLLKNNDRKLEAFIVFLTQKCRNLDQLQHSLMHIQYCLRLATLLDVSDVEILDDVDRYLNELRPTAASWSVLKFVRWSFIESASNQCE